jgi:hypothetical protein
VVADRIYIVDEAMDIVFSSDPSADPGMPYAAAELPPLARWCIEDHVRGASSPQVAGNELVRVQNLVGPAGHAYFAVVMSDFDARRAVEKATKRFDLTLDEAQALAVILAGDAPENPSAAGLYAKTRTTNPAELIDRVLGPEPPPL